MKIVVMPQVAGNKGDRAILYFMLNAFIENNVNEIVVATSHPNLWEDHNRFRNGNIRFICDTWMTYSRAESKVPYGSIRYYSLRVLSKLRATLYRGIGYWLLRTAVVNKRFYFLAKIMCYLCNRDHWSAIKNADAIVTSGGHRITTLLQPDVKGHQTFGMAMVLLANKKLVLWSQTIGSFDFKKEINKKLIGKIINHSERIYVRDIKSVQEVKSFLTDGNKIYKTYDSVFGLRTLVKKYCETPPTKRESILGISVYTGKSGRNIEYNKYIQSIAELIKRVVNDGFSVKFFPMHLGDRKEHKYFTDIIDMTGCAERCYIVDSHIDTIDQLKEIAQCKLFLGHKTHSIIFALVTATPLIAIAYHVKAMDFMRQFGLDDYSILESETDPVKLITLYEQVKKKLNEIHVIESEKSDEMCHKVRQDFMEMICEIRNHSKS